jgi:hypothetical protein
MATAPALPPNLVDNLRHAPVHAVLLDLMTAARDARVLATPEFRKLVAYLMEFADGRDRREPWTARPGVLRPVPKLRVAIDASFGEYGDLHWFRLNKTTNRSGQPLLGLFPRMAASVARVELDDFAGLMTALLAPTPDAALLRLLQDRGGRMRGMGVELFSRLAFAMRMDLYFVLPKPWVETSGVLKYIGDDLRRYLGLCRNLRTVSDALGFPAEVRGGVLHHFLAQARPPALLLEGVHKALGPSLARYTGLDPAEAYEPKSADADDSAMPLEFAAKSIRARRGLRKLRDKLLRIYGDECALMGACPRDLLEVAHVVPYPTGDVHAVGNAMLMRSDVHTMWDLNLFGIDPSTLRVHIAPALSGTDYESLSSKTIMSRRDGSRVVREELAERWRMFVNTHSSGGDGRRLKPSATAREEQRQPTPTTPATPDGPGRLAETPVDRPAVESVGSSGAPIAN